MKQIDILNQIEEILKNSLKFNSSESNSETKTDVDMEIEDESQEKVKNSPIKDIFNLIVAFFISVIKAPFQLIHLYIKNEIVSAIRKEIKLYFVLIFLIGILFTIFIVFWVLISLAIGFYFQELGFTNYESILLSIVFQAVIFLIVFLIFRSKSKQIKSLRMINKTFKE